MWDVQRHQTRRSEEIDGSWERLLLETRKTWNNCDLSIRIIDATVKMLNSHNLQKKKNMGINGINYETFEFKHQK